MVILSLTSFRFFVAFAIFCYHTASYFKGSNYNFLIDEIINGLPIFMTGFFVLSGFILTHIYSNYNFSIKKNILIFYSKRFSRIYPVYIFVTLLYFVFSGITTDQKLLQILLTDFFMLQGFFVDTLPYGINNITWSLSVEMFLYLVFPFILILTRNAKLLMIFSLIFSFIISINFIIDQNRYIYANPICRIADFTFGIGIYFLREKLGSLKYRAILHISSILLIFYISNYVKQNHMALHFVTIPLFGIWITCSCYSKSIIYNNKITQYLGSISYSFYLWQFFLVDIGLFIKNSNPNVLPLGIFLIIFLLNILISSFSYFKLELKARAFFASKLNNLITNSK